MENTPDKKPRKLKQIFNKVAGAVKFAGAVAKDTFKDLNNKKEIGLFAVAFLVPIPGASVAYITYRVAKYHAKHKPANDNKPENDLKPQTEAAPENAKPAKKKKPGFKFGK